MKPPQITMPKWPAYLLAAGAAACAVPAITAPRPVASDSPSAIVKSEATARSPAPDAVNPD